MSDIRTGATNARSPTTGQLHILVGQVHANDGVSPGLQELSKTLSHRFVKGIRLQQPGNGMTGKPTEEQGLIDRITVFSPEAIRTGLFPLIGNGFPVVRL
jgi:hypothetical protein